jgi:hypothetical protein
MGYVHAQVHYGFLDPDRRDELRSVSNAVTTDGRMCKIYAVLHLLGFGNISDIGPQDKATLTLVEKYVKFKQGEVWRDINIQFHVKGFRPTGADRNRLQSGLDFAEHLANVVTQDQRRLLEVAQEQATVQERQAYTNKLNQAKLEYDIKFYKKDKSLVSAKEKQEARQARDAMLAKSRQQTAQTLEAMRTTMHAGARSEAEVAG